MFRNIPWDKVDIEVLSVETDMAGKIQKDSSPGNLSIKSVQLTN